LEWKDDGILVHLATFVSTDGKLSRYYDVASQTLGQVAEVEVVYSDAAKIHDGQRPVLLHYAAASHQRFGYLAVVERLLKVYPEAASTPDSSGQLALHTGIEANALLSVLEALLHATPDGG
jgi:hypothetical protein